jgi:regulator of Ty1 transposition protein 103
MLAQLKMLQQQWKVLQQQWQHAHVAAAVPTASMDADAWAPVRASRWSCACCMLWCFCREGLVLKLQRLSTSQQSIESVSSFCIFYSKDARGVVQIWEQEFYKAQPERKLALLYLANHILQEGRKKGMAFQEEFFKVLPKAITHMAKHSDDKAKRSLTRIVTVWEERRVFGTRHMKSFREALGMPAAVDAKPAAAAAAAAAGGSGAKAAPAPAAAAAAAAKLGPVGDALSLVLQTAGTTAAKSQEFTSSWSQVGAS